MTQDTTSIAAALPHVQPGDPAGRLLLFGMRQMGAHGLNDAACAQAFLTAFGVDFRRPLILLRTLMYEMSQVSARPIQIAPWCCRRMTGAEGTLLTVVRRIDEAPETANFLLADLLGIREASGVAAAAHMVANAFSDLGLPLRSS